MNIIWKGSPNYLPRTKKITQVIIHWFGVGTLESANTRFQNPANQVSAHYGVSKGRVWQWVKESDIAFHAGVFLVNETSIGIENDATLTHDLLEEDYKNTAQLVKEICQKYNIPLDRKHILRHGEVKSTKCCGSVDVDKIIKLAKMQNQTKVVLGKDGKTVYTAVPVAISFEEFKKQADVQGIDIPNPIPPASSL